MVQLTAKDGYTPKNSVVNANTPIILQLDTNGTFDCSSSLAIPKLGIYKQLPASGSTEIAIKPQFPGTVIDGSCSMGMYNFQIKVV